MNWDKKITISAEELYNLISSGLKVKPSKGIANKSSFNTGVYCSFQKICAEFNKLLKN
jgi:hypothetical protein